MNERLTIANDVLLAQARAELADCRKVKLRAKGDSMRPFIHGGEDTLVIVPVNALRRGDIVLALIDEKRYVAHRIVGISDDTIILAGDANLFGTEKCGKEDVLGIVSSIIRDGRERNITGFRSRMSALLWRWLLPLRRAVWKFVKNGDSM